MPILPRPRPVEPGSGTIYAAQPPRQDGSNPKRSKRPDKAADLRPNPLILETGALLALAAQLRSTPQIADLQQLRARIVGLLQHCDEGLRRRGVGTGVAQKAHFVLCALIDEVAESMPWGSGGHWQRLNPLPALQRDRPAESTVRQLAQLSQEPGVHRDLCELIYCALSLGFEARGRGSSATAGQVEPIRARLAASLRREAAGTFALSARWHPAVGRARALASWLPLWAGTFLVAGLLAGLYFALTLMLAVQSDRVFAQIAALRPVTLDTLGGRSTAAAQPRLAPLLNAGAQGLQVRDEIDRSIVTLRDDALFEPANANLLRSAAELLKPIATTLQSTPGRVLIIGHTDRQSERSARFPSNWELSVERAHAVYDALRAFGLPESRMRYDGRADTEPLAPGGQDAGPLHNGRIEIVLLAGR